MALVPQYILDTLHNGPFPKKYLVINIHKCVFHFLFDFCDQMYAVHEQFFKKVLSYICPVREYFPEDLIMEGLVLQWLPIVHIALCYKEVDYLALLVDNDMELEPKEPRLNGTGEHPILPLPFSANPLNTLYGFPLAMAYIDQGGIHKGYSRTLAQTAHLKEHHHRDHGLLL